MLQRLLLLTPALLLSAGFLNLNLAAAERRPRIGVSSTSATCSASLADGRSFLTGGSAADNPIATASFFHKDGQITAASAMLAPRSSHICIALEDGSILVAGGSSGPGGPTSSAELYSPAADSWTTTGAMLTARTDAAAILLASGKVLIAGGQTSGQIANTLEIYDPSEGKFRFATGVLSSPRARHALAVLRDGRVLVAGGFDGSRTLDTIDLFDPESETVRPAGFMSVPREDFTATELADGRVLLAGGFDGRSELASAELYDPATGSVMPVSPLAAPRRNHLAIRPPGSDNVMIVAGTQRNAEIFIPSRHEFVPASETTPGNGATVAVGALDSAGKPTSVRIYAVNPALLP